MCDLCDLALEGGEGFIITICRTCHIPMIVSRVHNTEFSKEEKQEIIMMFPSRKIRWTNREILDHAHCHLED